MLIAGVDEVGRGPLAGPVVTAAVILPDRLTIDGLTDSKKLSAKRRAELEVQIRECAIAFSFGSASREEIDALNILHATMLAMQRAIEALPIRPDFVRVDGNRTPKFSMPSEAVIGGDGLVPCISAASILAKQARDALMADLATCFPSYGWERNSGYPTKQHLEALHTEGVCVHHRRSFAPVAKLL